METELERLVVRLVGDATGYLNMLNESAQQAKQKGQEIEETLTGLAQGVSQALLGFSLKGLVDKATEEYDTMIRTQIRLEAALKSSGQAVEETLSDFQAFAAAMQETTELGDDTVLALLKTATNMGLVGDAAKKATKDAIALGAAGEVSAETALRISSAIAKGDIERAQMFSRSIVALRGVKDQAEFLQKYQTLVASGWESAQKEADTFTGQMNQLGNVFGDLFEEFGAIVADALKPFVQMGKQIVAVFQDMSPAVKTSLVAVTLLGTALLGLPPIISAIWALTNSAFGGLPLILGAVAIGVSALVGYLGGFTNVWEIIQDAASTVFDYLQAKWAEFRSWIDPVWRALQSLGTTVWEQLKTSAASALSTIQEYWDSFVESFGGGDFSAVKETVLDAVLAIEFAFMNFSQVAEVAWAKAKLEAVVFADTVMQVLLYDIPTAASWFADNFVDIFKTAVSFVSNLYMNFTENVGRNFVNLFVNASKMATNFTMLFGQLMRNLPQIIKGNVVVNWDSFMQDMMKGVNFEATWKPLTDGFVNHIKELPKFAKREIGPLEKALREEFERVAGALGMDWDKFRKDRKAEFAVADIGDWLGGVIDGALTGVAGKGGLNDALGDTANVMKKGKEEAQGFDAALRGSAEAFARMQRQRDMMAGTPEMQAKRAQNIALAQENRERREGMPMAAAIQGVQAALQAEGAKDRDVLSAILAAIKGLAEGGGVELQVAGLQE